MIIKKTGFQYVYYKDAEDEECGYSYNSDELYETEDAADAAAEASENVYSYYTELVEREEEVFEQFHAILYIERDSLIESMKRCRTEKWPSEIHYKCHAIDDSGEKIECEITFYDCDFEDQYYNNLNDSAAVFSYQSKNHIYRDIDLSVDVSSYDGFISCLLIDIKNGLEWDVEFI